MTSTFTDERTTRRSSDFLDNKEKKIAKQSILIPVFDRAVEYTDDTYWQKRLTFAARNRFPKYFYHQNGFLIYNRKNRDRRIPIPDSPKEAMEKFIEFLQTNGSIYSDRDIEFHRMQSEFQNELRRNTGKNMGWTDVSRKIQISMLKSYAIRQAERFDLTLKQRKQLETLLVYGHRIGAVNSGTVVLSGRSIKKVKGVYCNPDNGIFYLDEDYEIQAMKKIKDTGTQSVSLKKMRDPIFVPSGPPVYKSWIKFVTEFNKSYQKSLIDENDETYDDDEVIIVEK